MGFILRLVFGLLIVVASGAEAVRAQTSDYPSRPVRLIVGYPAGGTADTIARVMAQGMGDRLGQRFVVENRPGAGSMVAATAVARSENNGYTLLLSTNANILPPAPGTEATFNYTKDFDPVTLAVSASQLLVVQSGLNVKTVRDFIALAKAKPNAISFASVGGVGSIAHLTLELFKSRAGIEVTHVSYPGFPIVVNDMLMARVDAVFAPATSLLPHVREGKVLALASTESQQLIE